MDDTDWERIVLLYEALGRLAPSPVVDLNRAAAVAMASGPGAALEIVDGLVADGRLAGYRFLSATRAELLVRLGRNREARAEFEAAAELTANVRERKRLEDRASELPSA